MGSEDELLAAEAEFQAQTPPPAETDRQTERAQKQDEMHIDHAEAEAAGEQPRKKLKLTEADKKRSVRMFGALMGTLSKFQDETSKTRQTEAAQRRAAVENRLQAKLKTESEALHQLRECELEEKNLKNSVWRKTEELAHLSEFKLIHFANKLAFSNYLCTSSANVTDTDRNNPPVPPHDPAGYQGKHLYWLPNKLLPEQKELIENQRRSAREAVEEEQARWLEEKANKQNELEQLCITRDTRLAEIEANKAKSRLAASSATAEIPATEEPSTPVGRSSSENQMRVDSEIRAETPEAVASEMERDEDAVEY
ncbi:hypothetical protein CROQUDRAFT_668212 [Cronartium quercuum f. sp. fusiforme G11]|uniref:Pinin/SDK/MemA protein domain-containing protein n=1 Tax=Cronartium quercuum f. sp. fusiforme G11 TaxID=708437 RepID=A0A9P6NRV8_9BASI|nr:hypothetical protein CROQUDRAFT_668212 [Cronartium quercuum f. sp. fusiforme G11]